MVMIYNFSLAFYDFSLGIQPMREDILIMTVP